MKRGGIIQLAMEIAMETSFVVCGQPNNQVTSVLATGEQFFLAVELVSRRCEDFSFDKGEANGQKENDRPGYMGG